MFQRVVPEPFSPYSRTTGSKSRIIRSRASAFPRVTGGMSCLLLSPSPWPKSILTMANPFFEPASRRCAIYLRDKRINQCQYHLRPLPQNGQGYAPAYAYSAIPQTTTGLTKQGGRNPALFVAFLLPIHAQIAANNAANLFVPPCRWYMNGIQKTQKKGLRHYRKPLIFMVPGARLELARCCHRRILSPLRLPIPPSRRSRRPEAHKAFRDYR